MRHQGQKLHYKVDIRGIKTAGKDVRLSTTLFICRPYLRKVCILRFQDYPNYPNATKALGLVNHLAEGRWAK